MTDSYTIGHGELVVDLTGVTDVDALDGRTISATADVGRIEILVPDDLDVEAVIEIDGPGGYDVFGRSGGGFGSDITQSRDGDPGTATITIDASLEAGEINIDTE